MKELNDLHMRVVDKGLFLPLALRLARAVSSVSYYSPCERAFEILADRFGDGYSHIQRVNSIWTDLDNVDCWVFPDIGFEEEQRLLRRMGLPVWGHNGADILEVSRGKFLNVLRTATDLPVPPHEKIIGMRALREYLRDKEDLFVKVSRFRGDWETLHWRSYAEDCPTLDAKAVRFGPFQEQITFWVFEPIDTDIEDGCDTWCIEGEYPSLVIHGMECKDKAYLGTFQKFDDLPEEVRTVNKAFAPILASYEYRGFFSTEVRIKDGESYFIDPTCRAGSPPSQVMAEMVGNLAEVIWQGANGKLIEPFPAAKFGAQALVKSKRRREQWSAFKLDPELERWFKSANSMMADGAIACPPSDDPTNCDDWLVGIGDTPAEAIVHLKHNVSLLPDGMSCEFPALAELVEKIEEAEEEGMEFTDQPMPKPEIVLEK